MKSKHSYSSVLISICNSYIHDLIIMTLYGKFEIVWSGGTCLIMGSEGGRFYGRTPGGELPVGHRERVL